MHEDPERTHTQRAAERAQQGWERPAFEVISLACEISAYAPDEGLPLL